MRTEDISALGRGHRFGGFDIGVNVFCEGTSPQLLPPSPSPPLAPPLAPPPKPPSPQQPPPPLPRTARRRTACQAVLIPVGILTFAASRSPGSWSAPRAHGRPGGAAAAPDPDHRRRLGVQRVRPLAVKSLPTRPHPDEQAAVEMTKMDRSECAVCMEKYR